MARCAPLATSHRRTVASYEAVASSAPDGENSIPWFGPNFIRTITSARSAPVMPDIMDHVTLLNAAEGSPVAK